MFPLTLNVIAPVLTKKLEDYYAFTSNRKAFFVILELKQIVSAVGIFNISGFQVAFKI